MVKRQRRRVAVLAAVLAVLVGAAGVQASVGDRSPAYKRCTASCRTQPSLLWSCPAACQYSCQQHLTDLALLHRPGRSATDEAGAHLQDPGGQLEGLPLGEQVQFHGKWAFHRLDLSSLPLFPFLPLCLLDYLFIPRLQEPLSVLFSLANLWAHYRGLTALRILARTGRMTEGKRLARVYEAYAWSGINAWTWSAVFHTRDVDWTERADYFAAAATMLVGLWGALVRLQGWYASASKGAALAPTQRRAAALWTLALAALFVWHCAYLALRPRFDYTYNMRFNVAVALGTIALWAAWVARQARLPSPSNFSRRQLSSYPSARTRFRAPHYLAPLVPLVALPSLSALELLDFAPVGPFGLRVLDAHALWHASTVPLVLAWYRFLVSDVRWIDGQGEGGDPSSVLPAAPSLSGAGGSSEHGGAGAPGLRAKPRSPSFFTLERLQSEGRRMTHLGLGMGLGILNLVGASGSVSGPSAEGGGAQGAAGGGASAAGARREGAASEADRDGRRD
ncbi:hypothetical protein Rhopal_001811-T1 [Rhodotorula paludigena]|uniref:Post-GPI attachment to proteins factor 3 n=1 Tax=Rhodotorula paludigena TaxID=86838 RepID=A0AAV5GGH2_9BASI|nr:hypothetical protein Rhopal_001811-T1 [Rhodotorula paludigena]